MSQNIIKRVILHQDQDLPKLDMSFTKTFDSIWVTIKEQFGLVKKDSKEVVDKLESMYTTRDKPGIESKAADLKARPDDGQTRTSGANVIHEEGRTKIS